MIDLGPCEITSVFGPMASGKTFLIQQWLRLINRYVRFDATGESLTDSGVEHFYQDPYALYQRLKQNPFYFRVAYHPGPNLEKEFHLVLKALWSLDVFKTIVCDEFHEVCSVNETPEYIRTMLRYARHARLSVVGASQRIADVHKLFTAGCRQTILFWTQEARDLDAIAQRWGNDAADAVANRRPLLYDDTTKITRQVPQCIVLTRGSKFRVYDFQTQSYGREESETAVGDGPSSELPSGEVQRKTDPSESPTRGDNEPRDGGTPNAPESGVEP